jgi:hypothetical protein
VFSCCPFGSKSNISITFSHKFLHFEFLGLGKLKYLDYFDYPLLFTLEVVDTDFVSSHCSYLPYLPPPTLMALRPNASHDLILEVSRSHTTTHQSRQDSSGRVISASQRPLPENTQQSQKPFMPPGWIRTHNLNRRVAAELRLGPGDH